MKNMVLGLVVLFLSGCLFGIETRDNFKFLGLPPSTAHHLAERCGGGSTYSAPFTKKEIYE